MSFNGLVEIVVEQMGESLTRDALFVFGNKRHPQVKLLCFDVSVIAGDEGVYTQGADGVTVEVVKFISTLTASA